VEVVVRGKPRYFDAKNYDGTNVGRFSNQTGVLKALKDVRRRSDKRVFPFFEESEWKDVNDDLEKEANAYYKLDGSELQVFSKVNIEPSDDPVEIFTSYGDIRSFWIAAIVREPTNFPQEMVRIVRKLFNASRSNWSLEQKVRWGSCEDLINENGKVCTFIEE
jgi:hypothetical protein